jgi:hypothetical protein
LSFWDVFFSQPHLVTLVQGDRIGGSYRLWAIVCFGQLFENYSNSSKFGDAFSMVQVKYEKWVGNILGDFLTNSSGHTGQHSAFN